MYPLNIIISLQRGIHGHLTPPPLATPLKFIAIPPIWYASPLQKGARIEQVSLTEWRFSFIPEAGERAIVNVKCFFSKKDFTAGQQTSQKCVITHHHGEITTIKSRCETSSMYWNETRLLKYQTDSMSMLPSVCSVIAHRWGQHVGAERRCY